MRQIWAIGFLGALTAGCSGETVPKIAPPETSATEPSKDGEPAAPKGKDGSKAPAAETEDGPKTVCETTRAYFEGCGNTNDLTCGADFDAWCAANDKLSSDAFRRAEAACLTAENCDGADRRACEYSHYSDEEKPTASQKALVNAYCQTCEPEDVDNCTKRSVTFNKKRGIDAVPDIFVAAWELADPLVDKIKSSCTGKSFPSSGQGPSSCSDAFAKCAGDIYMDRVPDCPK